MGGGGKLPLGQTKTERKAKNGRGKGEEERKKEEGEGRREKIREKERIEKRDKNLRKRKETHGKNCMKKKMIITTKIRKLEKINKNDAMQFSNGSKLMSF